MSVHHAVTGDHQLPNFMANSLQPRGIEGGEEDIRLVGNQFFVAPPVIFHSVNGKAGSGSWNAREGTQCVHGPE